MRLFFENKFFNFLRVADFATLSNNAPGENLCPNLKIEANSTPTPEELLEAIGSEKKLYVVCENPERCFENFCSQLPVVRAAGGIVENGNGDVLIMTRKGWRDLPKGHIEEGESSEEAAVREVMEETGLQEVEIVAPLHTTYHFHNAYGRWEIKQTEWFLMYSPGDSPAITPEQGENITAVEWLRGRRLWQAVDSSYSTIKELFEKYLEYKIQ
jgi:ADP-ribose pyrophosphatase YjhB (NUDIX family)